MSRIINLEKLTQQVRRDILRMVHSVNSGHPGGSLGCAEFFVALYNEILDLNDGFDMDGKNEDLFFLSNGHISPVFYSVLAIPALASRVFAQKPLRWVVVSSLTTSPTTASL